MGSIKDDRGYNQGFKPSITLEIRTERRCEYIIQQMDKQESASILEIGCGTGEMSYLLASKSKLHVLGTDLCLPFIEEAKSTYRLPNLRYEVLDFNKPNIGDQKFDYIVGNGILHHLYTNLGSALQNIKALLKENGKIIFLEPNLLNPYCFLIFNTSPMFRKMANLEPDEMAFTKRYITDLLKMHKYFEIKVEYKDFLLPNTPLFLVKPIIKLGSLLEKTPLIKNVSQSIFISAKI
jgi:2-polyprenyl-3-methyl-5-hydroxy-6-metoxy-1,4-benzoquinol methylase